MCVLAIAWRTHPRWRMVVAANRDEFHDRPAAPLAQWDTAGVIAGRDLQAGGTWLGVAPPGRFAAVTNLRGFGDPDPARLSRGTLVTDLVAGRGALADPAAADLGSFNPFNAVLVAGDDALFLSNRPAATVRSLAPGYHAMSNGPLDPPWRKTVRLTGVIERWLDDGDDDTAALFDGLRDPLPPGGSADDPSAIFVENPVYGTRCSTLVTVDAKGAGMIAERRYDGTGHVTGDSAIRFEW